MTSIQIYEEGIRFCRILVVTLGISAPYVILGLILAGFAKVYASRDWLLQHLGRKGLNPIFKSAGIGALIPVCSCSVIPLGVGLRRLGAGTGTVLCFMTSSPALSPLAMVMGITHLGWSFTLYLVLAVLLGSVLLGVIGNRHLPNEENPELDALNEETPKGSKFIRVFKWGIGHLGTEVSFDLFIGLSIATAILAWVSPENIQWILGDVTLFSVLAVIILAIPIYTCSLPSIMVAQSMLLTGAAPGLIIAYLIAGPATNLGELNAIRHSFGIKSALFYSASLLTLAFIAGLATPWILPENLLENDSLSMGIIATLPTIFNNSTSIMSDHWLQGLPTWHIPFLIPLGLIIVIGAYKKLQSIFTKKPTS